MSVCTICYNGGTIPACPALITFGTVTPDTVFNAWIKTPATTTLFGQEVTSDEDGLVTVDSFDFDPRLAYEVWLTAEGTGSNSDKVLITVDTVEYSCIKFETVKTFGDEVTVSRLTP